MSDIDYNKFSFKDYRRSNKGGIKSKRGKVRYNFINYEVYKDYKESAQKDSSSNQKTEQTDSFKTTHKDYKAESNLKDNPESNTNNNYKYECNIEDLRTKKKYKRKVNVPKSDTRKIKNNIIAIMVVVICFMLTIVSADMISGGAIFENLADVLASSSDVPVYYAVEVGSYTDIQSARDASDFLRQRGAGGYVINDSTYRVIASVYSSKEDAETVITKLINDGLSATLYEIKGAKVNYNKYGEIGNSIEDVLNFADTLFNRLYVIGNSLDSQEITENDAKIQILAIYNEAVSTKEIFIDRTKEYPSDETVLMIRAEVSAYIAILSNLNNDNLERPSLLSDIRYSYAMIANSYCATLRTLK